MPLEEIIERKWEQGRSRHYSARKKNRFTADAMPANRKLSEEKRKLFHQKLSSDLPSEISKPLCLIL